MPRSRPPVLRSSPLRLPWRLTVRAAQQRAAAELAQRHGDPGRARFLAGAAVVTEQRASLAWGAIAFASQGAAWA